MIRRIKLSILGLLSFLFSFSQNLGVFEHQTDIGPATRAGNAQYDVQAQHYSIAGSGANIWGTRDEFHFVWKKIKGDFLLQAQARLEGKGTEAHRKTGWMIRSSLDTASAMACIAIHGDGLASLQYRLANGSPVSEIKSDVQAPDQLQLERSGKTIRMYVAQSGQPYKISQIENLDLGDDVYVGLFICAHNKDVTEHAAFNNVRIIFPAPDTLVRYRQYLGSTIELMNVATGVRQAIYSENASLQAPNWSKDGKFLLYNKSGQIYTLQLNDRKPMLLQTGAVNGNNNDHVLSFDGRQLGLSGTSPDGKINSVVYTVPVKGGIPFQVTPTGPSYLHGWSPDANYLVFTGMRNNDFDIYRIPSKGGPEVRLTDAKGLDDGPEYSPDGKYIYFNSVRSGTMQVWRMNADGSNQVQLTHDEFNNWFPHISPDGKLMVMLSFTQEVKPDDHPFYKKVYLRIMDLATGNLKVIAYVYGGQGTINTPSWSPDSKTIAFVSNSGMN